MERCAPQTNIFRDSQGESSCLTWKKKNLRRCLRLFEKRYEVYVDGLFLLGNLADFGVERRQRF